MQALFRCSRLRIIVTFRRRFRSTLCVLRNGASRMGNRGKRWAAAEMFPATARFSPPPIFSLWTPSAAHHSAANAVSERNPRLSRAGIRNTATPSARPSRSAATATRSPASRAASSRPSTVPSRKRSSPPSGPACPMTFTGFCRRWRGVGGIRWRGVWGKCFGKNIFRIPLKNRGNVYFCSLKNSWKGV